jgi:hypothetical protein
MIEPTMMPSGLLAPGVDYSLDSTALIYAYVRNKADVNIVDTLVLTFVKSDNTLIYTLDPSGDAWEYQDIIYDTVNHRVATSSTLSVVTYALTAGDSTTYDPAVGFNLKELAWATPQTNLAGKRIGVVVSFRPGYTWVPFVNGNPNADSLLGTNSFWLLSYEENGDNTDPTNYGSGWSHNMSYVIDYRSLYAQWDDIGWNGFYLPAPFWASGFPWEHHAIYFKVCSDQVGVETVNAFNGLAAYPNPVQDNLTIALDLATASDNLVVSVTDVLGRDVVATNYGTKAAGKHTFKVSTANLANGVYSVSVKSGSQVATAQVVVNR